MEENATDWSLLFHRDSMSMFAIAVLTVAFASYRSIQIDYLFRKNREFEELSAMQGRVALLIPVFGSVVLLLFFYFFSVISILTTLIASLSSIIGFVFTLTPLFTLLFPRISSSNKEINVPCVGPVPIVNVILFPFGVINVLAWLVTGHWMLNNFIGISMVVVSISFMRVPNIKVATFVLCGLFVYDIFWVFYSSRFFGKNVMVEVATKEAVNPVKIIASKLNLPEPPVTKTLQLPMKLIWGSVMLGLGDMVMPGLLTAYSLRIDYYQTKSKQQNQYSSNQINRRIFTSTNYPNLNSVSTSNLNNRILTNSNNNVNRDEISSETQIINQKQIFKNGYFLVSMIGYFVGLFIAMTMAFVYRHAQPALLYLVPCTLIPVLLLSVYRGEFLVIWNGIKIEGEDDEDIEHQ